MKGNNVLYLIKSFQKELIRCFSKNMDDVVEMNNKSGSCSVTLTQIQIIEYIMEHQDKEVYQRELENVLNLRRATVSGVLQTMEKNGLVERVGYLEDARVKKIILNDKAKELFSYNKLKLQGLEKAILNGIDKNELETFSRVLDKMKNNISIYNNKE